LDLLKHYVAVTADTVGNAWGNVELEEDALNYYADERWTSTLFINKPKIAKRSDWNEIKQF
jgi:hypothetical protein